MAQPIIIIEISGGNLQSLYSNMDVRFFVVDQDNAEAGGPPIAGPFSPTLVKEDLTKVYADEPAIDLALMTRQPETPYF